MRGEFALRQYLGGTDHSAVFLTERGAPPQKAAIKLVPVDSSGSQLQLSHWEAAARLSHPHLIRLFETGNCQLGKMDLRYVVMEYAEEDLSQILPHRALAPAEVQQMLRPVGDALVYLHQQGFVHGHVKPSNIMAVADQIKLSSDGVLASGDRSEQQRVRDVHDPPESATARLSPAADSWSLGVTLVEALTQRPPEWEGTANGEPILREKLPEPFDAIVRNSLRRDPQRREKIPEIAARLAPPVPAPPLAATVSARAAEVISEETPARPRSILPFVAAAVILLALFVGWKLLHRAPEAQTPETSPAATGPASTPASTAPSPAAKAPAKSVPVQTQETARPSPAPPASRTRPATRQSTAVSAQAGVVQQVLPEVSRSARNTIQGRIKVRVRVSVDGAGNVKAATLESPGPSKYFARLATQAAKDWKFAPAQVNGQNVASTWRLLFEFGRKETKAVPERTAP